ncbi:ABC transporter ATP-binding protein [Psychrosphaera haliotis]|uniref:ATP-binding cassette domain-containing protein n=1 Tax=Psychrosphaera haliotis TaxID=555083 RepID=A0A6N8FE83_9GAMM|nr:ABC transporter ATP-binding protein [Psychrosphaera haliotis]MUH72982.1 ATP-binding cassette domain-containing protein [Psychrosphaera haliotis]
MSLLSIKNLSVNYGEHAVIKGLDLSIASGEIVALFGPSGSGKSTILKAVTGLLKQTTGDVVLSGKVLNSGTVNLPTEQRNIGLIFQDYALFPHLTVFENITFGIQNVEKKARHKKGDELLALIKMAEYKNSYPHQLSGGQQQRVAIARALATQPDLLLFDEAFSNLDPQFRFELIEEIRDILKSTKTAALFVTHNQNEAFIFCDKIAVLHQGEIAQIDTPSDLFDYPVNEFVTEFIGAGVWLPAVIKSESELQSEWGPLPYKGKTDLSDRVGETIIVYLRPHQIGLNALNESDTSMAGPSFSIASERFVGEFYESTLTWHDQSIKVRTHDSFYNQKVRVRIKQPIKQVYF